MEEVASVEGKLQSATSKNPFLHPPSFTQLLDIAQDPTALIPPPQKLRPVRSSDTFVVHHHHQQQQLGFPPPPPPEKIDLDEEMSAETLLKMKAEMDASFINSFRSHLSTLSSSLSSSSDSSGDSAHKTGEDPPRSNANPRRKKRKKMEWYLENLMSQVIHKQEQMHEQLMELIENKERERISREEDWRRQEMERSKRNEEVRSQEAAQNLALISFIHTALGGHTPPSLPSAFSKREDDDNETQPDNKRWPTSEVQALITLRAALDHKFHIQASKASVWEEISAGMATMGFARTANKCKEKWANINKFYKKATSSGKQRSEIAKSCPYFHELETLFNNQLLTDKKANSPSCDNADNSGKV